MSFSSTRPVIRRAGALAATAVLAVSLTACGGDDPESSDSGMSMDMSAMNDPDATPADQIDDAAVETGDFTVLDTAPPGSDDVAGEAWLAHTDGGGEGTTVTIRLAGLEPDTDYVAHLHAEACSDDNGGDHFKFDPDGSDVPPNEVHLAFTSTDDGTGEATITNESDVEDRAPALVVHPADALDNRLACADFS